MSYYVFSNDNRRRNFLSQKFLGFFFLHLIKLKNTQLFSIALAESPLVETYVLVVSVGELSAVTVDESPAGQRLTPRLLVHMSTSGHQKLQETKKSCVRLSVHLAYFCGVTAAVQRRHFCSGTGGVVWGRGG